MPAFIKVAKTTDIHPGQGTLVEVGDKQIALFNIDGSFYAIDDTCSHQGGPLSEGDLDGTKIMCPWHGATFDVTTGDTLGPPARTNVTTYKVRVKGSDIEVAV